MYLIELSEKSLSTSSVDDEWWKFISHPEQKWKKEFHEDQSFGDQFFDIPKRLAKSWNLSLKLFANDSSLCSAVYDINTSISNLKARSFKNFRISSIVESSRLELFCKKGVLRNFTKFTGKHLCQSLLFNKVAALRSATLLKKRLWHWRFSKNFEKYLRTLFYRTALVAASA